MSTACSLLLYLTLVEFMTEKCHSEKPSHYNDSVIDKNQERPRIALQEVETLNIWKPTLHAQHVCDMWTSV